MHVVLQGQIAQLGLLVGRFCLFRLRPIDARKQRVGQHVVGACRRLQPADRLIIFLQGGKVRADGALRCGVHLTGEQADQGPGIGALLGAGRVEREAREQVIQREKRALDGRSVRPTEQQIPEPCAVVALVDGADG